MREGLKDLIGVSRGMPKRTFEPRGDLVALHVYRQGETEGGLKLPDIAEGSVDTPVALVIAAGPKCEQVKAGDRVLISHAMPATRVQHAGNYCIMVQECQIIGVLDELPATWSASIGA